MGSGDKRTLGVVSAMYAHQANDGLHIHMSFGRIVDQLAKEYDVLYLCVPVLNAEKTESRDYLISAPNVVVIPQPRYTSSAGALRKPWGILKSYWALCGKTRPVFVRGMVPFIGFLYLIFWIKGVTPCHWLVGNPEALLKTHKRGSRFRMIAARIVATLDRWSTVAGQRLCHGTFLCNWGELGKLYESPRTKVVVSSTVLESEIFLREDACTNDSLNLLFVGFLRPEKGVEYLLEAVSRLAVSKDWRLNIVGDFDNFGEYRNKIFNLVAELGIEDRIDWLGYVPYGPMMFSIFRSSDLMVLPTLSEGTPRVLVEARAFGVPVIATNVGGIPSSITDGVDGLLVPPKSPGSITEAIGRIVEGPDLRKSLVSQGYKTVFRFTVESFVSIVVETCSEGGPIHEQS